MNRFITAVFCALLSVSVCVQDAYGRGKATLGMALSDKPDSEENETEGVYTTIDPQFEWSQFKDKKGSAIITNKWLTLECKLADHYVASTTELPLNPESDTFVYGANFIGPALSDDTKIGIIFDFSDNRNYKAIDISKNQYSYFIVKDGVASTVKTGLIKCKTIPYRLQMRKEAEKITFSLNDIEFAKLNKIKIENAMFGVMLEGKGKTAVPQFTFYIESQQDGEENTSDI